MILFIYGEENFLSLKKLQQIKDKFIEKNSPNPEVEILNGENFSFDDFLKIISASPFFSKEKLVVLKNFLSSKITEKNEEKLSDYLSKIPNFTFLVFLENTNKFKNKKLANKIIKLSKKKWEFQKLKNWELEKWANQEIKKNKGNIDKLALEKLISFVGNNLWQLEKEVEKLVTYKNSKTIEENDIEKIVSANLNTNIFELIDNISQKNAKKTLHFLNNLIEQGEEILYLLGMITYQIRNLIVIKELSLKNLTKSEIIKETKKHPFVVQKTLNQIKNFSLNELEEIYNKIFDTELKIKTGKLDNKTAINILAAQLCLKPQQQ